MAPAEGDVVGSQTKCLNRTTIVHFCMRNVCAYVLNDVHVGWVTVLTFLPDHVAKCQVMNRKSPPPFILPCISKVEWIWL